MFKRYYLPLLIVQGVVLAIFSILVFSLGSKEAFGTASFILSYVFIYLSVALGYGLMFLVDQKKKHDESINELMLFFPANIIAYLAFFLVNILALIIRPEKTTFVLISDFILLIVYCAYAFLMYFVVAKQSENREHIRTKVRYIRVLEEELVGSADLVDDENVKKVLIDLSKDVRFSDPMSHESLTSIEDQLFALSGEIRDHAEKKEFSLVLEKADKMSKLLKERNRKCKILK